MRASFLAIVLFGLLGSHSASAVECRNGVYREGCVGPNGAAVVRKPPTQPYGNGAAVVRRPPSSGVACANGVYHAGCVGPNGAAVVRKPY